jgi:hypothetical protein
MKLVNTLAITAVLAVSFGTTAHANLVVNGGFETGDLTGWTDAGNTGWHSISAGCGIGGSFCDSNGAVGSDSILQQTINTVPGEAYTISFWLANDGGGGASIWWNGNLIASDPGGGHGYLQTSGNVIALGNDLLEIHLRDDPGFVQLDDVAVDGAEVPEPGTIGMLLGGIPAIGFAVRRRLRK